jgi:hypothetical protein
MSYAAIASARRLGSIQRQDPTMTIQDATTVSHVSVAAGPALRQGLVVLATLPILFAAVQVGVTRRVGARTAWLVFGITAAAVALLWFGSIAATWPNLLTPIGSTLYMIVVTSSIPFVASTLVMVRSVVRHQHRSTIAHFGLGWLGFVGGLMIGLVLGLIPDLLRAFA